MPLAIMNVVWRKFHILNRTQVFVVASVCSVVIGFAVALASIPADGVSWGRFLGPSRQLDPFINFGSAFISVLPVLLGYYHLARVGALMGIAISAFACFATQVCAEFIFGLQVVGRSTVVQEATYVGVWLLLGIVLLWAHIRAYNSDAARWMQHPILFTAQTDNAM